MRRATTPTFARCAGSGYGRLVEHVEAVSGFPSEEVRNFFAIGMFLNVIASMELHGFQGEVGRPHARGPVAQVRGLSFFASKTVITH